jgi:hypothetical protein
MHGNGRSQIIGLIALALLAGAGCAEWLGEPPAIPALPTLTPSPVFSPTPPVIEADTPTPITPTATATLTPTPRASPTPLIGPTATLSDDALTLTALGPGARGAPVINYFVATPDAVAPGEAVVLFWSSEGGNSAAVYRLDENGEPGRTWAVEPEGSLTVVPQVVGRPEVYVLAVTNGITTVERRVAVEVTCPDTWFFAPPLETCPSGPASFSLASMQLFERGRMIWIELTDQIVVLLADGLKDQPAWLIVIDPYVEGSPEGDPAIQPPAGFLQPLRGFGALWRGDATLRERIGWAIGEERAYQTTFQRDTFTEEFTFALTDPDGAILVLEGGGVGWYVLTPETPEAP